jgi:hypothetical protein
MIDHPYIDFDGDGHGDSYDTVEYPNGIQVFVHHEGSHIDAIAFDKNHDGLVDEMMVDDDGDGDMDRKLWDANHDGYMDGEKDLPPDNDAHHHPYIDFDGDGHGDSYYTTDLPGPSQLFVQPDGYGHIETVALDHNHNGYIDEMHTDEDHDAAMDHVLWDNNNDGVMDTKAPL